MSNMRPGTVLANGATVVAVRTDGLECIVLAVRTAHGSPWITWRASGPADTFWGHYYDDLDQALADFKER